MTDSLQTWGAGTRLGAFESLMWRLDGFPGLRGSVVGIEMLAHAPDWGALTALHRQLIASTPRLHQRPAENTLQIGHLHWVDAPLCTLEHHLRRITLPTPATHRALLDFAQSFAMEAFDADHSPWQAVLVEHLDSGQAAYIFKLHHCLSDGMGIVQLLSALNQPLKTAARSTPAAAQRKTTPTPDAPPAVPPGARLARYAASARRVLAPYSAPPSALLAQRSGQWHFETMMLPFASLHAAARAAHASLNDAFLAGVLGGFGRYHARYGTVPAALPIAMPISIRRADTPTGGNHFAAGIFAAPLAERDPVARMRRIALKVAQWRNEPALALPLKLMNLMTCVPAATAARAMTERLSRQDLQISNVPGFRVPVALAGAPVTALYPFAPLPGCAGMLAMVSYATDCGLGFNLDAAAVAHPAQLMQDMGDAFTEILALGTSHAD
ncbi:MAG: DUF1298 domain-containing protein [Nevskiaceae bacterium]|nr:MAG: DUF1298 domain-containing protein [Nevskiaceae bacterium]TBR71880.1 MAG: DUF1298 domain-containing protein [Nevskiaceae bacterium]